MKNIEMGIVLENSASALTQGWPGGSYMEAFGRYYP